MTRRPIRVPGSGRPLLDIFSAGRAGTQSRLHFSRAQIEQIARTVRRTPEVMVKVTGGGASSGAVSAHFGYISRHGELEIETDEGERIPKESQKEFLEDWHLELIAGQYRAPRDEKQEARKVKLVHKIVLSMPARRRLRRCSQRPGRSLARSLALSIVTQWCCTPTRHTRTCTWS
jgi:hypothetical protein